MLIQRIADHIRIGVACPHPCQLSLCLRPIAWKTYKLKVYPCLLLYPSDGVVRIRIFPLIVHLNRHGQGDLSVFPTCFRGCATPVCALCIPGSAIPGRSTAAKKHDCRKANCRNSCNDRFSLHNLPLLFILY